MTKTNFFTQLADMGLKNVSMEIKIADDSSMTVFVTPKSEILHGDSSLKAIVPFRLTAFPADLDNDFFATISEPMAETGKVISNMEDYKKQLAEAEKAQKKSGESKTGEKAAPTEKQPAPAPKLSKVEQAKLDKITKAEETVLATMAKITDGPMFTTLKDQLSKEIMILGVACGKTGDFYDKAKAFFDKNNNQEGLFTPADNVLEAPNPVIEETVEKTTTEVIAPLPPAEEEPEVVEAETEDEAEETAEDDDLDNPGNSLSDMQAERTEDRKSQLRSLGLTEDNTGFTGHGFNVRLSTIENHTEEYWAELIKGIQEVVNRDTVLIAPESPAPMEVVKDEKTINVGERYEARKEKLFALGMTINGLNFGLNFVGHTFTHPITDVKSITDEEFEKMVANIIGAIKTPSDISNETPEATAELEARTKNRIIELISYGFKETGDGLYTRDGGNATNIGDIEKATDREWETAMGVIKTITEKQEAIVEKPLEIPQTTFEMSPTAQHTYEAYRGAGWSEEQMEQQGLGKRVPVAPVADIPSAPAAPQPPVAPTAPGSLLDTNDELEIK